MLARLIPKIHVALAYAVLKTTPFPMATLDMIAPTRIFCDVEGFSVQALFSFSEGSSHQKASWPKDRIASRDRSREGT